MLQTWTTPLILASALTISVVGVFIWKKKRRTYVRVGKIGKLFIYPVKSLKALEVTKGTCTKLGFEVNGVLDRSFMLVNKAGAVVSQSEAPTMASLTPHIKNKTLSISTPSGETLEVEIKDSISQGDKVIPCKLYTDIVNGVDCGEEAAVFFQSFLKRPDVRLVQHFANLAKRKYIKNQPYIKKVKNTYSAGFQNDAAFHIISQAALDDLNSKIKGQKVSALNFRANIVVDGCAAFEEDSWRYMKFDSGAELAFMLLKTRCLLTTNDPFTGTLSRKEPLVTMRKYRIPADPEMLKITQPFPCFGTACGVIKTGDISVGDDIYADIGPLPKMRQKLK